MPEPRWGLEQTLKDRIAVVGNPEERKPGEKKISFWGWEFTSRPEKSGSRLSEADGAKRLPVKVPTGRAGDNGRYRSDLLRVRS